MKPTLPLSVKDVKITKNHNLAVYYEITFVDADGKLWSATHAHFHHDLKEVKNDQLAEKHD